MNGLPTKSSGWSHASGLPTKKSGWAHSSGEGAVKQNIAAGHPRPTKNASGNDYKGFKAPSRGDNFVNASGVGVIKWNPTGGDSGTGAYEDPSGKVYIANGDGTYDDGSGNSFNADGSLAGSSSNLISNIFGFGEKLISAQTTTAATTAKAQVAQSNNSAAVANNWVMPTLVVGGIAAVGFAYWLYKRK